jgi:signal transduction histidine kinase
VNLRLPGIRQRLDRSWLGTRAYLLLGIVFGTLWFGLVLVGYLSGIAAQFLLVGMVFILAAQLLLRPIGRFERWLVARLLDEPVPEPEPLRYNRSTGSVASRAGNLARRGAAVFRDEYSWRVLLWTLVRFCLGPFGFLLVVAEIGLPLLAVLLPPLVVLDTLSREVSLGLAGAYGWLFTPATLVLLIPLDRIADVLADLYRRLAVRQLGPGRREITAAALARAERAEEQVRIDQELHDSIGHMLSMIVVQAGAGAHVFDRDPQFARSALRIIEERGRAALGELDRIIAGLRDDRDDREDRDDRADAGSARPGDGAPSGHLADRASYAPLPGGADLPGLVSGAVDAGLAVTSRLRFGELPAAVGSGVYRIVQEALTNAAKHAPGSPVEVEVVADHQMVAVSVVNQTGADLADGSDRAAPAAAPSRTGRGLSSIRERAALLGGQATVGAAGSCGFAVRAVLPLGPRLPTGGTAQCSLTPQCSCLGCRLRRSVLT